MTAGASTHAVPVHLRPAYRRCRDIHRVNGRSYYLATKLLPARKRPHVHALYGFTRWADDIVDGAEAGPAETAGRRRELARWGERLRNGLSDPAAVEDGVLAAVLHTIRAYQLDPADFELFLASMAMDLTITDYPSYQDLLGYMAGSAAAIGSMMVPILGVRSGLASEQVNLAYESARQLGLAFQLTNFIRDVGEDLGRGRVYLPEKDLTEVGMTVEHLRADLERGHASPALKALIEFECHRAWRHYAAAVPGIELLEGRSRVCIRAAMLLYGQILVEVSHHGYDVCGPRTRVGKRRRAQLVGAALTEPTFRRAIGGWPVPLGG